MTASTPSAEVLDGASDWLDADRLIRKIALVRDQAREDFPSRGLPHRIEDLRGLVEDAARLAETVRNRSPLDFLFPSMAIMLLLVISVPVLLAMQPSKESLTLIEFLEPLDAGINVSLLILGLWFVIYRFLLERRRNRMMVMIHRFRSIVHMLDLIQLTKNITPDVDDPLTVQNRIHYLDLCSQTVSLAAKGAALLIARYSDPHVISTVNEVESVCSGISQKIWAKIAVLHTISDS